MPSAATIHVNVRCGDEGARCGAQELGAGCGLSGMVAAAAGAGHVVLADQVLYMLRENVARNFAERAEVRERIAVRELQWGDAAQTAAVGAPFDLLLGSDLMYVSEHWGQTANAFSICRAASLAKKYHRDRPAG